MCIALSLQAHKMSPTAIIGRNMRPNRLRTYIKQLKRIVMPIEITPIVGPRCVLLKSRRIIPKTAVPVYPALATKPRLKFEPSVYVKAKPDVSGYINSFFIPPPTSIALVPCDNSCIQVLKILNGYNIYDRYFVFINNTIAGRCALSQ